MSPARVFARLLLACALSARAVVAASFEYDAKVPPEDATPKWALVFKQGEAVAGPGGLRVESPEAGRHLYAIGVNEEGAPFGEAAAWDLSSGRVEVVFRLRCETEDPEMEVFRLILRDGARQWQVPFTKGSVYRKPIDTTEWDTYTATVENGTLRLSSERHGLIVENRKAQPDARGHALYFGSYAYSKDGSTRPRAWELAFLRWSNEPSTPSNP